MEFKTVYVGSRGAEFVEIQCDTCGTKFERRRNSLFSYNKRYCSHKCYRMARGIRKPKPAFNCIDCGVHVPEASVGIHDYKTAKVCSSCEKKRHIAKVENKKIRQKLFVNKFKKEMIWHIQ